MNDITQEDVERLISDENTSVAKHKADQKRAELSNEEWHRLRVLCKRNLFFLANTVLGYKQLSTNLHGNLCGWIDNTNDERFRELLLPRGHYKTTIFTKAHTIQIFLPYTEEDQRYDDDPTPIGWPYNLGTDVRILLGHETNESAARFLFEITTHVTSNALLMALYPEIIPTAKKQRINKWELELPRNESWSEPTIDTLGVGGKSQGRHYNYIKLDDIFGDKARDSKAEADTTKDWFDGIQSFFSRHSKDHLDIIGTRYSFDDIYNHAHERYKDSEGKSKLVSYIRKVEELVIDAKTGIPFLDRKGNVLKVPIFPEEFNSSDLDIQRKNKQRFAAEYENDPYDGESGFEAGWKKYFYWTTLNPPKLSFFTGDAAKGNQQRVNVNVRDLDVIILIDPGQITGGFVVTGMDYQGRVFVLQAIPIDLKAPALVDLIFKMVIKWQPRLVAIEADANQHTYQYWLISEMSKRGIRFKVEPAYTKRVAKDLRIKGLTPYAEAGKLIINAAQEELESEWTRWGKSRDIHILDALAYGPEFWRPGYAPGQRDLINAGTGAGQQIQSDPETGYSAIN